MTTIADATFWNRIAAEYAEKPVELPEAFERKIAITRALMAPHHRVLDIGCGTGSLALRLADQAEAVSGVDISEEMIRIARGKASAQGAGNVAFHVGPLDDALPFAAESLDGVCAYSLLHLVDDPAAALAQIFSRLKPGGFFVSSTVCLGDTWFPYRPLLAVMRWLGRAPRVRILRRGDLIERVRTAGFVDIDLPEVGAKATTAFMVARRPR